MDISLITRDEKSFQKSITQKKILAMCERGLGGAKIKSIRELSSGLFNNTYLVETPGDRCILRVSPHPSADVYRLEEFLMRREYDIQPYLSVVNEIIPRTIFADFTRRVIDRDYVFQTYIEGTVWDEIAASLSKEDNSEIWYQVGEIARRITSVKRDYFGHPQPKIPFSSWSAFLMDLVCGMKDDLARHDLFYMEIDEFIEKIAYHTVELDVIKKASLIHGDLWPKNILVQKKNSRYEITGVLDSERAYWGDEISEWIHYLLEVGESYWQGYGEIQPTDFSNMRKLIYKGIYLVQIVLEIKTRFFGDAQGAVQEIAQINKQMMG